MRAKKFALQALLEERLHRERLCCAELADAQQARDCAARRFAEDEQRHDAAGEALARCAREGRVAEARGYDDMLRVDAALRLRRPDDLRRYDAEVVRAAASVVTANRERRTLERLRERLEARRAWRRDDD